MEMVPVSLRAVQALWVILKGVFWMKNSVRMMGISLCALMIVLLRELSLYVAESELLIQVHGRLGISGASFFTRTF